MRVVKSTFVLVAMLSMLNFSGKAQDIKMKYNIDDSKIALSGFSAVSYIELGLAQRGSKQFKSTHDGLAYYFISAEQKGLFDKNPTKYLPQFGGWCATGVAVNAKFRTDPNKFLVTDGKLFLFLYDLEVDAKELWLKDEKGMESKAIQNWKKLRNSL